MSTKISLHAVERYVERIDPAAPFQQAQQVIQEALLTASRQREKTLAGDAVYLAKNLRLVVAEENGHREVLTVLALDNRQNDNEELPEVAKALQAEFDAWEKAQAAVQPKKEDASKRESSLQKTINDLQACCRRRAKTIQALLTETQNQKGKVSREKYDRQLAHGLYMTQERTRLQDLLKTVAVRLLAGQSENALKVIEEEMPGYVAKMRKLQEAP